MWISSLEGRLIFWYKCLLFIINNVSVIHKSSPNTQKVVICGRDSPNTQLSSIRPWTITAAYSHNNSQSRLVSGTGPRYQNSSLGPVPDTKIALWDRSQIPLLMSGTGPNFHYWCLGPVPVSIIDVWDQIITQIIIKVIWSQLFEMGLWDWSQFPLFMSGTR